MLKLDPKNHERVSALDRRERCVNDYADGYEENTLYAQKKFGEFVVRDAKRMGMKVGDWELLPQEEKETLLEWEQLLEEDIKLDSN